MMRGFVHLKQFLTISEQLELLYLARNLPIVTHPYRSRYYGPILGPLQVLADLALKTAQDPLLQRVDYSHMIMLHYTPIDPPPQYYIPWHSDNGDNDGNDDYPIVSFSIGDSCTLLVSPEKPKIIKGKPKVQELLYESGDAVIWGGPARGVWHAIRDLKANTSPLQGSVGRYNFTLRYTPQLLGDEDRFHEIPSNLERNNRFYRLN